MTVSRVWEIEMTARSPISHRGELIGLVAADAFEVVEPGAVLLGDRLPPLCDGVVHRQQSITA
ncbi:hypothetical protein HJ581_0001510 (plasmid) [Rhodococcus opacus]|uniref:hypothetical protein n=1 Tax=Rhodococcus opacus TaxID=37919 RepID=UPI0009E73390|nr:hypothetical protein [Rhodococcus opacus]MDV7090079.1 hypothetical protein [Rhodococcus opacus]UNN04567.1 hypothetical protein MOO23_36625 [Rhodococcus opacus]WKN52622.1 hypothetical protein HJ581_0001510 [Rhodococcus opacus]